MKQSSKTFFLLVKVEKYNRILNIKQPVGYNK